MKVMPGASPSNGIATVVFWLIFVFFIFSAIGALQVPALTTFMNQVLAYLPNVIVAIFIFVLASLVAGGVAAAVAKVMGDTPTGKIVATIVPAIVMVIAMFMILEQLQIAPEIVRIAFAATMGALALGLALAFGLGGRGVAAADARGRLPQGSRPARPGQAGRPGGQGPRAERPRVALVGQRELLRHRGRHGHDADHDGLLGCDRRVRTPGSR